LISVAGVVTLTCKVVVAANAGLYIVCYLGFCSDAKVTEQAAVTL
jgi:hypothetical protein